MDRPANLSLRHLTVFREVMRRGSVSEAARALGRTQPAVSAMIAGLEAELGFMLFERVRGRLNPTPEARYFLEEAEAVLERLQRSVRTMREIGGLERGVLRIACNPAASNFFMPRLVSRFVAARPGVRVSLMTRSSEVVTEWIASQRYDIGLGEAPAPRPAVAATRFDLACVCALPLGHPLAARDALGPAELDGAPMAVLYEGHVTTRALAARFAEAGAVLDRRFELQIFLPALRLVEEGLCLCVCDPLTAASYAEYRAADPRLVFRPFRPTVSLPMAVMTPAHRPASQLAAAFAEETRAAMAALGMEKLG
jgi:DNA-binding transcriptional LysR family regulator